jgi:hypothetical protein
MRAIFDQKISVAPKLRQGSVRSYSRTVESKHCDCYMNKGDWLFQKSNTLKNCQGRVAHQNGSSAHHGPGEATLSRQERAFWTRLATSTPSKGPGVDLIDCPDLPKAIDEH